MSDQVSNPFRQFIPIHKIDAQRREVWGWGAVEEPDHSDEIMDYATSKPHVMAWSTRAEKRSGGKSKGNVRSMHQPIAAGKLIDIRADDKAKGFFLGAKITDDQEWRKVEDGTYTGFSIGGNYLHRWQDTAQFGKIRYTAQPTEWSLVDAPCIDSATFDLVKMDGSTELRKFKPTGTGRVIMVIDSDTNEELHKGGPGSGIPGHTTADDGNSEQDYASQAESGAHTTDFNPALGSKQDYTPADNKYADEETQAREDYDNPEKEESVKQQLYADAGGKENYDKKVAASMASYDKKPAAAGSTELKEREPQHEAGYEHNQGESFGTSAEPPKRPKNDYGESKMNREGQEDFGMDKKPAKQVSARKQALANEVSHMTPEEKKKLVEYLKHADDVMSQYLPRAKKFVDVLEGELQKMEAPSAPESINNIQLPSGVGPNFEAERMPDQSNTLQLDQDPKQTQAELAAATVFSKDLEPLANEWLAKIGKMVEKQVTEAVAKALDKQSINTLPAGIRVIRNTKLIKAY